MLVLEHAVDAGNGLHQVVALHGFVHVQRVHAGRIKAGEPHVAHDYHLQRVCRVFEAFLEPFLDLGAVNVWAQQRLVAGRACHHDLDGTFFGVGVMPVGAQPDDFVVQVHTNVTAHGDHHGLAALGFVAFFKVADQVGSHTGHAGFGADNLFQCCPAALEFGLGAFLFVLGQLVHFVVEQRQVFFLEFELGQARLVIDGDSGAVFLGLLHVIDMDVVTKDGAGVVVGAADRRAGEGDKSGVWQCVTQVLGVTCLVVRRGVVRHGKLGPVGWQQAVAGGQA